MNDATPPPLPKKRFELPKSLLIIWFILFGLTIYLGVSTYNLDSEAIGALSGRFVGISLISLLLSWVAWRISRRSDWVKATVFLVTFFLFSAELIVGLSLRRRVARSAPMAQLQHPARRIQEAQIEEFKKTGAISPNTQAADQMIATIRDAGSSGNDLNRKVMIAFADALQNIRDGEAKHTQASDKMDSTWIVQPKTAKSIQEIAAISASVTNFMQVNQEYLGYITNCVIALGEDLKSKGVPASQVQGSIRSFNASFNPQIPFLEKIRQQDHEVGQTLLQILELYKAEQGKWNWDEQNQVAAFSDKSIGDRWLELVGNVNDIAQEQQQTQTELINLRTKNLSRSPR